MLYNSEIKSMGSYPLTLPMKSRPGTRFNYSSGDTNVLNLILKTILQKKNYKTYPWDWLFNPLEMKDISFEMDQSESFVGSSYLYLSKNDLLKIGQLILDKGLYKGKRIISENYINYATTLSKTMEENYCLRDHKRNYGAQFWLNMPCPNGEKPFHNVSGDVVMMLGYSGQNLILFPKRKSMALRFANDEHGALKLEQYLALIERRIDEN
jgi:CubicO group peptidase (beta-lactamase class C family)